MKLYFFYFIFQINSKHQPEFSSESEDDDQPEEETSKQRADSKCKQTVSKKVNKFLCQITQKIANKESQKSKQLLPHYKIQ